MIFITCFAAFLLVLFVIFPVFFLFFYPTKMLRKLLSKCLSSRFLIFLSTFMEKFHCCYKDGLDDTIDMRSFSGIYFLLRIIIYSAEIINMQTLHLGNHFSRGFIFSVAVFTIALSRPYKQTYMNVMDCILLFHMATLCYTIASTSSLNHKPHIFLPLMQVVIGLPFIIILLLAVYRLMTRGMFRKHLGNWWSLSRCLIATFLKKARRLLYGRITTSQNLESTYGTIN